ncbi:unnamed protein product, partial [Nesidiocoris tenuis]
TAMIVFRFQDWEDSVGRASATMRRRASLPIRPSQPDGVDVLSFLLICARKLQPEAGACPLSPSIHRSNVI